LFRAYVDWPVVFRYRAALPGLRSDLRRAQILSRIGRDDPLSFLHNAGRLSHPLPRLLSHDGEPRLEADHDAVIVRRRCYGSRLAVAHPVCEPPLRTADAAR